MITVDTEQDVLDISRGAGVLGTGGGGDPYIGGLLLRNQMKRARYPIVVDGSDWICHRPPANYDRRHLDHDLAQ